MKTKLEILEEIVNYYSEDTNRRAVEGLACEYITPDNRRCAVGLCLIDPTIMPSAAINDPQLVEEIGSNHFQESILENFEPEYRIDDVSFWSQLQKLHDNKHNWDNKGLTSEGNIYYDQLKKKYTNERI